MFGYDAYKMLREKIIPAVAQLQPAGAAAEWTKRMQDMVDEDEVYYLAQFIYHCETESSQPQL